MTAIFFLWLSGNCSRRKLRELCSHVCACRCVVLARLSRCSLRQRRCALSVASSTPRTLWTALAALGRSGRRDRILCLVPSRWPPSTRLRTIQETWGSHCDRLVFTGENAAALFAHQLVLISLRLVPNVPQPPSSDRFIRRSCFAASGAQLQQRGRSFRPHRWWNERNHRHPPSNR